MHKQFYADNGKHRCCIITTLQAVKDTESTDGHISLEHLRELPTDEVKLRLNKLPGLGPKSVSCVVAFTLDRYTSLEYNVM
jgi:3-methyladenine DNA glycosylase/8-oxoguanine DNA glycosylase